MARWWCVASADPVPLQRIVAASLIGLLGLAALDPALPERSALGQGSWLAGMLLAGLALVRWRRDARSAAGTVLGIDSSATLYRVGTDPDTVVPVDTSRLGAWQVGPWQFIRFRDDRSGSQVLAFDRRHHDGPAWAALQRALVRARRHPAGLALTPAAVSASSATPAPPATDTSPRPPRSNAGR